MRGGPSPRLTHQQHVDLVGHKAQLTGHAQQHKGKLPDLGHAQADSHSSPDRILEEPDNERDEDTLP